MSDSHQSGEPQLRYVECTCGQKLPEPFLPEGGPYARIHHRSKHADCEIIIWWNARQGEYQVTRVPEDRTLEWMLLQVARAERVKLGKR